MSTATRVEFRIDSTQITGPDSEPYEALDNAAVYADSIEVYQDDNGTYYGTAAVDARYLAETAAALECVPGIYDVEVFHSDEITEAETDISEDRNEDF